MLGKIALIEDEEGVRTAMTCILQMEQYEIRAFCDGSEFIAAMRKGYKPDLVVTDLSMPDTTGFEVISYLRKSLGHFSIPIVAMTGGDTILIDVKVLKKPFDVDMLLSHVETVLPKTHRRAA